jgi:hypothetical protein
VVEITHTMGPAPRRKKLRPARYGVGIKVVSAMIPAAMKPVTGPSPMTAPKERRRIARVANQRANNHADAVHRKRGADARRR